MSSSTTIKLLLGGVEWEGWESVTSTRRINACAGEYNLTIADKWRDGLLPVAAGLEATLLCDDAQVHTGYLNAVTEQINSAASSINISGRDKSWDLAECSLTGSSLQYLGQTLGQLAREWCAPFGVAVDAPADTGPAFTTFKADPGETVWAALDRAARQREFFVMPTGRGGIRLIRLGAERSSTVLAQGDNIIGFTCGTNSSSRFSDYIVQAQRQAADNISPIDATNVMARAHDSGTGRYRPLVIRAENQMDESGARLRAQWELKTRRAASFSLSVTVQGWRDRQGNLWQPNTLVPVSIPAKNIAEDLLITAVTSSKSASGSLTTLELKDPVALGFNPAAPLVTTGFKGPQEISGSLVTAPGREQDLAEIARDVAELEAKKIAGASTEAEVKRLLEVEK